MIDLAPEIFRQRLVIEGIPSRPIGEEQIKQYLVLLSDTVDMTVLSEATTSKSPLYGWAGWIHWETSGAHFYAWDKPQLFFSVDIYTCKPFDPKDATEFTASFFDTTQITSKEF
jgi:hypothetical protein